MNVTRDIFSRFIWRRWLAYVNENKDYIVFRSEVSERMQYKTAEECENHYKQCYLIKPQSPLPGTDMCILVVKVRLKSASLTMYMWQVMVGSAHVVVAIVLLLLYN